MPRVLDEALLLPSLSLPLALPLSLPLPLPLRFAEFTTRTANPCQFPGTYCLRVSFSSSSLLLNSPASQRQRALRRNSKAARLIFNLISSLISHLICKPDTVRTRRGAAARRSTSAPSIIYINICLITGCLCHEWFPQPPAPSGRRVLAVVAGYETEKKAKKG